MMLIVCLECSSALHVAGDFNEIHILLGERSEWYPDRYPCWTDGCGGLARFVERLDSDAFNQLTVHNLTTQEAFLALNGMGFPKERDCGETAVKQAFASSPVRGVGARHIHGTNRCVVDHIELENGTKIFFGAAPEGAIVYRLSRPHSYTREHEADTRTRT